MDHFVLPPDAHFEYLSKKIGEEMQFHFFPQGDVRNRDGLVEQGNLAIAVHNAGAA